MTASPAATTADLDHLFFRMEKMVKKTIDDSINYAIDTKLIPLIADVANEILTAVSERFDEVDARLDRIERSLPGGQPPRWLQTL